MVLSRACAVVDILAEGTPLLHPSIYSAQEVGQSSCYVTMPATPMQVPVEYALGTLRLSTGRASTVEEVDAAAQLICKVVKQSSGG